MRAVKILQRLVGPHLLGIHAARVKSVFTAIEGLIRGGDLSVSRLGRAIAGRTSIKHGIKRADRLYGNPRLRSEAHHFYRGIARETLRGQTRPILLVDWTEAGPSVCVLAAAVPCDGRALVIYAEAHPLAKYTSPRVEAAFLSRLRAILPSGACPILVTDAGFRGPWFQQIARMGWDYVGRVRGRSLVRPSTADQSAWVSYTALYSRARVQPIDLGLHQVNHSNPYQTRLVVLRRRRRWAPIDRSLAQRARDRVIACAKEPWLLTTSLTSVGAAAVARIYRLRMQIEETFRDAKSPRFGWAMRTARTSSAARVEIMMLLAALAAWVVLSVGRAAEVAKLHRAFQANTRVRRRVLALTTLGRLVLLHPRGCASLLRKQAFLHLPLVANSLLA